MAGHVVADVHHPAVVVVVAVGGRGARRVQLRVAEHSRSRAAAGRQTGQPTVHEGAAPLTEGRRGVTRGSLVCFAIVWVSDDFSKRGVT